MNVNINISKKVFNDVYIPYLDNTKRYLVFYGGSGSGKSHFVVQRYVKKMLSKKRFNCLVVRETGNSNKNSTFALFKQIISKWCLNKYFKINNSELRIKCLLTKTEVIFAGLDDVEKLKSITFENGELTDIWIEEASEISEADFNQLDIRLRGKGTKKQIVLSFNPININHWLKRRFFDSKADNIDILHTTYKDNKFLDDDYKKLLEGFKDTDEYYYNVYCLGMWGVLGKTIFDKKQVSNRLQVERKPLKIGMFNTFGKWINDENGSIRIYHVPNTPAITQYCIGGDTAGEGSDKFTAHVIDAKTGVETAELEMDTDEDLYAMQIYYLRITL